jgi:hypothetical protein
VTEFSQPILDLIASRAPDIQDDFNDKSGGWRQPERIRCGQRVKITDGELVLTDCSAYRTKMNYADFVAEFDARFLPGTKRGSAWQFFFRLYDTPYTHFAANYDGSVAIVDLTKNGEHLEFSSIANPGPETNHLLVIAKGSKFAFYVNNKPFYFVESPWVFRQGDIWLGSIDIAAFDNFRIWDIRDITIP